MKPQVKTIKSNDFIPYFPFSFKNQDEVNDTNNCFPRSVKAAQIANLDLDFGMLFIQDGGESDKTFCNHGFYCVYSLHTWNTDNDGNIYDSNFQLNNLKVPLDEQFIYGSDVLVVDMEHLQKLAEKKGNMEQKLKNQLKIVKEIKKVQFQAKFIGIKHLYISGFSWNERTNQYLNTEDWCECIEETEEILQNNLVVSE
jgi:hypothetical protein